MSVVLETRLKRDSLKSVTIKSDKIKKVTNEKTILTYVNDDTIECDGQIKIKESNYKPEIEYSSTVKESNRSFFNSLDNKYNYLSAFDAINKICSKKCCLLDVRDCRTYQNGHIKSALLFNCQKRILVLKAKKAWDMFEDKGFYDSVIIYNQRGEDTPLLQEFVNYIKNDFKIVFIMKGGYEEFFKYADKELIESIIPADIYDQHLHSLTNESTKSTDVLNASVSEILPYLYLGNEIDSKDLELLKRKKITHILNVTNTVPFSHDGLFIYKRLSATDCNKQNMRIHYDEAFNFIDKAQEDGGKVLVHCWAGVSRSATIVAAYLLKHSNCNVLQTISFLRSKRQIVEPNFNFLGQLERFYCDLENNIETRKLVTKLDEIMKNAIELNIKDISLSDESYSSTSPLTPPPIKPYFNFRQKLF